MASELETRETDDSCNVLTKLDNEIGLGIACSKLAAKYSIADGEGVAAPSEEENINSKRTPVLMKLPPGLKGAITSDGYDLVLGWSSMC
eukprot:872165-Pyramimonas_sp.AAC.1